MGAKTVILAASFMFEQIYSMNEINFGSGCWGVFLRLVSSFIAATVLGKAMA